jgi:hypothetical protein
VLPSVRKDNSTDRGDVIEAGRPAAVVEHLAHTFSLLAESRKYPTAWKCLVLSGFDAQFRIKGEMTEFSG